MPPPDLQGIINKKVKELLLAKDRILPVKVGRAVRASIRQNFRKGGFYGQTWTPPMRANLGFDGPGYGPLLSGTNHLMMSTDYFPSPGRVIIQNHLAYAQIHNEGGEITVTRRMKKFFWSQYYKRGLVGQMYGQAKGKKNRLKAEAFNQEAEFWKAMALKKIGDKIKIPKRQFMGDHPEVDKIVTAIIEQELTKLATNGSTAH